MSSRNVDFNMQLIFLFVLLNACLESKTSNNAYCKTPRCKLRNLACDSSKNLSEFCVYGSKVINMRVYKTHILNELNHFRNIVADGYTRTIFPAARMAKMDWSNELEKFAVLYIKKCQPNARYCMSSAKFTAIGYIYDGLSYTGSSKIHPFPDLITELMLGWFDDGHYVTKDLVKHLTNNFEKPSVRQVTLLMTDHNSHVGCSGMTFITALNINFRFACAFATDNIIGTPIYNISVSAGSLCRQRDKKYKNLCALGEKYNNVFKNRIGEVLENDEPIM